MKLHAYGDSWTEGLGCDLKIEKTLSKEFSLSGHPISTPELIKFRHEHSWVKKLAGKLGLEWENHGVSASSNYKIFQKAVEDIKEKKVTEKDFVVVMWSSTLRDPLPFLPAGEWLTWSEQKLKQHPENFINSYKSENETYDNFLREYKKFFLTNLYSSNYYSIINQNYICFLQEMLKSYNIRYVFCDAFDSMINPILDKEDKSYLIDSIPYYGFKFYKNTNKTFSHTLMELKKKNIWEHDLDDVSTFTQMAHPTHPNAFGYSIIADILASFIHDRKIL